MGQSGKQEIRLAEKADSIGPSGDDDKRELLWGACTSLGYYATLTKYHHQEGTSGYEILGEDVCFV